MNYIEPIKDQLDEQLHNQCVAFMLMGTKRETPRYMNFGGFNNNSKVLIIQSTQTSNIFFHVQTDYDFIEVDKFWPQFKEYRTQFLIDNYPTIDPY
jgi:hypothetical protein